MSWTTVCDLRMKSYTNNTSIDSTDFNNDATILGNLTTHPGYVSFHDSDDQMEIMVKDDSLSRFVGLRLQALVKPSNFIRRYNIIEGWMSFAFFIESNGQLAGGIFDGQNWVGLDSGNTTVKANKWARVSFEYDGVSIAKLTLNGATVGSRIDMPAGMMQPQQVVTIGHWPRGDNRYTFKGDIGHLRIERRDYEDFYRDALQTAFCMRRLTPLQADAMREIQFIIEKMDPVELEKVRECAIKQSERIINLIRELRGASSRHTARLRQVADKLRRSWCCIMDGNAIIETLLEYFGELAGDSDEERKRFNALIEEFFNISKMCAWEGEPFDRIRSLIQIVFPELNTFEADLREIVNAV